MADMTGSRRQSLTEKAQAKIAKVLSYGDYAVDATVGNGNDTFFLADHVGPEGAVVGFDIQELALHRATAVLGEAQLLQRVKLVQKSHHRMAEFVPDDWHGKIKAIMFNLGYLPRGDKSVITQADTTILALEASIKILAVGGRMTVVAYTGHDGGQEETNAIREWLRPLTISHYDVEMIPAEVQTSGSPELYVITRTD
ncbi:class I SAM-dependent methyltransferase [Rubellicoccus peritrichatus]|uniref:Class I SAM-dependent methyltransferase n=1 Tax=Rubellicoccus peritrichatus TaxID=3080537 RepID=A0AAQ3LA82_9BACT|nr:class I SAM-dependent methyltransferase [Puniceicoccus sp. CR14]WOO42509.1 class I SAM-dependent methyltransferase [Puniceicoccus sp. CR14]